MLTLLRAPEIWRPAADPDPSVLMADGNDDNSLLYTKI